MTKSMTHHWFPIKAAFFLLMLATLSLYAEDPHRYRRRIHNRFKNCSKLPLRLQHLPLRFKPPRFNRDKLRWSLRFLLPMTQHGSWPAYPLRRARNWPR